MSGSPLADLAVIFGQLSLLAFGGGVSVLPEMQRQVIEVHPWLTPAEFASLFALAQASPGPNMLVVVLIGWRVSGLPGAFVAIGALCLPSSLLTYFSARLWDRFRNAGWRRSVQAGLVPVTAGLITAGAIMLTMTTTTGWRVFLLTAAATGIFTATRLHPLIVLAAAAGLGALGALR
jgi:chromate transporter